MCEQARELFKAAPSLVDVNIAHDAHITTCGDVHGQFYDLLNIWELNGLPSEDNPYLFNGAQTALHSRRNSWLQALVLLRATYDLVEECVSLTLPLTAYVCFDGSSSRNIA